MTTSTISLDVGVLNSTALAAVQAMFWGAIALAVAAPIAAAAGAKVAEKISGSKRSKRYD